MSDQFESIKIIEIDEKNSGPSGQGALMNIVLRLSHPAPYEWADYFERAWAQHIYMMKRNASVSGSRLTITCMPNELEDDHVPELNKIIKETNMAYAQYHAVKQSEEHEAEQTARKQREEIANLKKKIKFD